MSWAHDALYAKAQNFAARAHNEEISSPLFGFWMSLSLELLARAALSKIHPVLLADPRDHENIYYSFGKNPKGQVKSVHAKTVFARCSVFIDGFTDEMMKHCLIIADKRNAEIHSGEAPFENLDNSIWLPATYEAMEVLLRHLGRTFRDFLGTSYEKQATEMLRDRKDTLIKEVSDRISSHRREFMKLKEDERTEKKSAGAAHVKRWLQEGRLRQRVPCPACGSDAVKGGETLSRGPARIDELSATITREVRVLPNRFRCPSCNLKLVGFPEMQQAGLGTVYTILEDEDPIEFFGIVPEDYVDVDELIRERIGDYREIEDGYMNE
jgi:hypothetical protein